MRNWTIHNMIAHPLGEIVYWLIRPFSKRKAEAVFDMIHDSTVPEESR